MVSGVMCQVGFLVHAPQLVTLQALEIMILNGGLRLWIMLNQYERPPHLAWGEAKYLTAMTNSTHFLQIPATLPTARPCAG